MKSTELVDTIRLPIPHTQLVDYCARWKINEFALSGSVLTNAFGPASDVDVLVAFDPSARWTLLDHVAMQDELKTIFGRDVDLISKRAIEQSRNPIRRKAILESAQVIYYVTNLA